MFCPHCGTELQTGAAFCPGCGRQIDHGATTSLQPWYRDPVVQWIALSGLIAVLVVVAVAGGDGSRGDAVGIVVAILIGGAFYFLPSLIANVRHHHQESSIVVINLFLGWTLIGWVVALAMSVSATKK